MTKYVTLDDATHAKLQEIAGREERSLPRQLRLIINEVHGSMFGTPAKGSKGTPTPAAVEDEDEEETQFDGPDYVRLGDGKMFVCMRLARKHYGVRANDSRGHVELIPEGNDGWTVGGVRRDILEAFANDDGARQFRSAKEMRAFAPKGMPARQAPAAVEPDEDETLDDILADIEFPS